VRLIIQIEAEIMKPSIYVFNSSTVVWLRLNLMDFLIEHKQARKPYMEYEGQHDSTNLIIHSDPKLIRKEQGAHKYGL